MPNEPLQRRRLFGRLFRRRTATSLIEPRDRRPLLTPSDQAAIAVLAALAIFVMAVTWLAAGGLGGGLLNIDDAEPLEAAFEADINRADWIELMQLPEIGETLAKRIVESRDEEGPFASHDDLDRVPGIGPKTLEKIRPYLKRVE